jgi:hypothetical protein
MGAKLDAMKAAAAKPVPAAKPAPKTKPVPMPPASMPVMPAPVVSAPPQAEPQVERPKQQQARLGPKHQRSGRLPGGSKFALTHAAQDEVNGTWEGTLMVPQVGAEPLTFFGRANALFGLCSKLDGFYRKHVAEQSTG